MTKQQFSEEYATTLFLYAYRKPIISIEIDHGAPGYFKYELGINNEKEYQQKMLNEGFIEKAPIDIALTVLKLPRLKEIAEKYSLSKSGTKEKIIERILSVLDVKELKKYLPYDVYMLNDKGSKYLQDHYVYVLFHRNQNWGLNWLSIINLTEKVNANNRYETFSIRDTIWSEFNREIISIEESKVSQTYKNMAQFLMSDFYEIKDKKKVIELSLIALYYDMSGVGLKYFIEDAKRNGYAKKKIQENLELFIHYDNYIYTWVRPYMEYYNPDMLKTIFQIKPSIMLITNSFFEDTLKSIISGKFDEEYDKHTFNSKVVKMYMKNFV